MENKLLPLAIYLMGVLSAGEHILTLIFYIVWKAIVKGRLVGWLVDFKSTSKCIYSSLISERCGLI